MKPFFIAWAILIMFAMGVVSATFAVKLTAVKGYPIVIDGDTVIIDQETIRLHGIDAPEMDQPGGETAKRLLIEIIGNARVWCVDLGRGKYGRIIGKCRIDHSGMDIAAAMVRYGAALAYRKYSDDYVTEENAARATRRGLWRGDFIAPWDWRKGKR